MQLSFDTSIVSTLLQRLGSARRHARDVERTSTRPLRALNAALDDMSRMVVALFRDAQEPTEDSTDARDAAANIAADEQQPDIDSNVANKVDDLRHLVAKSHALALTTEELFESVIWTDEDRSLLERLAHLVSATAEAAGVAVQAGDELAFDLEHIAPVNRGGAHVD